MTSNSSNSSASAGGTTTLVTTGVNSQSSQQPTNIILQSSSPQQVNTIRKVGSSGNLSSLQKVQVINSIKPTIQILSNPGQRLQTKTTTITSSSSSSNISSTSNQTTGNTAQPTSVSSLPAQYQQVFQQQTTKLNPQQPSS